ncbi:PaaI family thioesterase [Pseudonocardia sp. GCM10023141]|uniref:PaaI family thioesterase n=1 Tax=Pseudonocardia sp. GCM10023141 TaxID=3252653 RepID=UPI00361A0163
MTAATELVLPWAERADSHCFGCAPGNPAGLGLHFRPDGDGLVADVCLDRRYESYPGVLHGGIVALVCDEVMGNLIVLRHGRVAVTTSMRMRYVGVIAIDRHYRCHATIAPGPGAAIQGRAEIRDAAGEVMATATATFQPVPVDDAGLPALAS